MVAEGSRVLGVIHLKDIVKGGIRERFAELREMGIKTVMITGDNPLTAAAIAAEAGVDDFLAQATPEAKLKLIRDYQAGGRLVAMTGDGTNDAPALAQADVAVAMNSGTQAAKEAANLVDLDSNPTKLIEVVEIGKQLLITRGTLTTFSIANDVAKYFAIIPAAFATTYPVLDRLNLMHLASPNSAILSAVIFNALIIIVLIPLALRRRQVPPPRGLAPAARQPADLWPGRGDRPLRRHQADRSSSPGPGSGLTMRQLRSSILIFLVLTVLTGLIYPLAVTGIAQAIFPHQANGSLIVRNGHAVGSELIGQPFAGPRYFWGRPSATAPSPTTPPLRPARTSGRPIPDLIKRVKADVERIRAANGGRVPVPVDLVTSSASGLDPHISPAAAFYQVNRVARRAGSIPRRSAGWSKSTSKGAGWA